MDLQDGRHFELGRRSVLGALGLALVPWTAASERVRGAVEGRGIPQYQGDAANTGYAPDECLPTSEVRERWSLIGDEFPSETRGSATDTLVAGDGVLVAGFQQSPLVAFDPDSGEVRWVWETDVEWPRSRPFPDDSCPAIADGTVYVGVGEPWDDDRAGVHGRVFAIDGTTGRNRWSTGVGRGPANVTVDGDTVYVGSLGALYAVSAADGSSRWNAVPEGSDEYIRYPAVADGRVYYSTTAGRVYAVDSADGEPVWQADVGAGSPPSVADGTVYVGLGEDSSGVRALDAGDGTTVWQYEQGGRVSHAPVVADGRVYANGEAPDDEDGFPNPLLTAVDASTGERDWVFETTPAWSAPSPPLVAGGAVVTTSGHTIEEDEDDVPITDGYVLDARTGEVAFHVGPHAITEDAGSVQFAVLDETLFVGDDPAGPHITALRGETHCGTDPPSDGGGGDGETHTLMVTANGPTNFSVTVDGTLEPDTEGGDFRGEPGDAPTENDDGTLTASDAMGPTTNTGGTKFLGDRFVFTGSIEDLSVAAREATDDAFVYLDERSVSVDEARGFDGGDRRHTLTISANGPTDYAVTVDGTLEPDTAGGDFSGESGDAPTENDDGTRTASDYMGPTTDTGGTKHLGDRFVFTGSIEAFTLVPDDSSHEAYVYIDERTVSPEEARRFEGGG